MSWIDNLFSSSLIVWAMIFFGILHLYLKKTGQTLPDFIKSIMEFFKSFGEEESK